MRIVRFVPPAGSKLGSEPHFGVMEDESTIRAIASDPLYAGIYRQEESFSLDDVRLVAPAAVQSIYVRMR